jgi:hypothetical protein
MEGGFAVIAHIAAGLLRKLNSPGDLFNFTVSHVLFYRGQQLFSGGVR